MRSERGQTTAEFLGVIMVVAAMVAVIATSDIDGQIARGVGDQVCNVLGDACATKDDDGEDNDKKARDADDDGLSDRQERRRNTLPGRSDSDHDDLTDGDEVDRGTDPLDADTDGDGTSDGREVRRKRDPGGRGAEKT